VFLYYLTSHLGFQISNFRSEILCVTSDNSHYSIVKDLLTLSTYITLRRNFNVQGAAKMSRVLIRLPPIECSSIDCPQNRHLAIANWQYPGGGEGIRTPDPRVANAVLCQLSYTPDEHCQLAIADWQFSAWNNSNWQLAIGNRQ
jgi:hypothetical protein